MGRKHFDTRGTNGVLIIAGFIAVGKTTLAKKDKHVLDLTLSTNGTTEVELKKFGADYVNLILQHVNKPEPSRPRTIVISAHPAVLDELEARDIQYSLVYPEWKELFSYLKRIHRRDGKDSYAYSTVQLEGTDMIKDYELRKYPTHYQLSGKQTLRNVYNVIMYDYYMFDKIDDYPYHVPFA